MENQPSGLPDRTRNWRSREPSPASTTSDEPKYRVGLRKGITSPASLPIKRKRGLVNCNQLPLEGQCEENPFTAPNSQSSTVELDDDEEVQPAKRLDFVIAPQHTSSSNSSDCSDDRASVSDYDCDCEAADGDIEIPLDLLLGAEGYAVKLPGMECTMKFQPISWAWRVGKVSKRGRIRQRDAEARNNGKATANRGNLTNNGKADKDPTEKEHKKKRREKEQEEKDWAEARSRAQDHWICHTCREETPSVTRVYKQSTKSCSICCHNHTGCEKCPALESHFRDELVQHMYDSIRGARR